MTQDDKELWERIYDSWGTDVTDAERITWVPALTAVEIDCLKQLIYPTYDGYLISKSGRGSLVDKGLVNRWNGLNFCNRNGYAALMLLGAIGDGSTFTGWNGSNNKAPR